MPWTLTFGAKWIRSTSLFSRTSRRSCWSRNGLHTRSGTISIIGYCGKSESLGLDSRGRLAGRRGYYIFIFLKMKEFLFICKMTLKIIS